MEKRENSNENGIEDVLFPDVIQTPDFFRNKYPPRNLSSESKVTRVAPSPTGSMHIGGLYMALISKMIAYQSQGVYFLRIEDTDKKREVEGAFKFILQSLKKYNLQPDEGPTEENGDKGGYGPYIQSERIEIYKSFVKELIRQGKAYPCFMTEEDLDLMRTEQEKAKIKPGYYGSWAMWRNKTLVDIKSELKDGRPFVIRFKSTNHIGAEINIDDAIRGSIEMPANDQDFVILKKDGLPTYHMAHLVDDFLMGTTDVLRGDEWISSLPIHHDLFRAFGYQIPRYGHIAPIQKIDNGNKRKLSKRKDPEASVDYYNTVGYPESAVIEYLMNLADSRFESWRMENIDADISSFKLNPSGLGGGGPLFDEIKLRDISKNHLAKMTAEEFYNRMYLWSQEYQKTFASFLGNNKDYAIKVFAIERGGDSQRRDIASFSEVPSEYNFFFDPHFSVTDKFTGKNILKEDELRTIANELLAVCKGNMDHAEWFGKMQVVATKFDLAPNLKSFKENPSSFRGQVGEIAQFLRYILTGKNKSPDLYQVISVLGEIEVEKRIKQYSVFL